MYAVIRTGGKQYTVRPGEKLDVEKLDGNVGSNIELTDVLLVADGDAVVGALAEGHALPPGGEVAPSACRPLGAAQPGSKHRMATEADRRVE